MHVDLPINTGVDEKQHNCGVCVWCKMGFVLLKISQTLKVLFIITDDTVQVQQKEIMGQVLEMFVA